MHIGLHCKYGKGGAGYVYVVAAIGAVVIAGNAAPTHGPSDMHVVLIC